ncbi:hypothetical protein EDB85DRAFT_2278626 [Lactarius pseudohatsudake]|nr:hypothetical protein EDB85DRAFT_2278626 [Lactarius pseudohatsudake]
MPSLPLPLLVTTVLCPITAQHGGAVEHTARSIATDPVLTPGGLTGEGENACVWKGTKYLPNRSEELLVGRWEQGWETASGAVCLEGLVRIAGDLPSALSSPHVAGLKPRCEGKCLDAHPMVFGDVWDSVHVIIQEPDASCSPTH